jgi:hypothetical protein
VAPRAAATAKVVGLLRITDEDRAAAVRLLEDIRTSKFAYRPNALILLWKILLRDHPERAKSVAEASTWYLRAASNGVFPMSASLNFAKLSSL